jgi:hypothetical protein
VNGISPGVVDTPMRDQVEALFARYERRPLGEKRRLVGEAVPYGRMGVPEDHAGAAVFLAPGQRLRRRANAERRRRKQDELKNVAEPSISKAASLWIGLLASRRFRRRTLTRLLSTHCQWRPFAP